MATGTDPAVAEQRIEASLAKPLGVHSAAWDLLQASPEFAARWREARIARHASSRETATATVVGPVAIDCEVLTVPGCDLRIVVYTAAPGSPDAAKLDLLAVAGLQTLS